MKFTLSWLKDYLKTDAGLPEILDAMMRAGLEVEHVEDPAEKLKDFSIAKVIEAKPHPDADKLRVCTVETKDGTKQIVCGAPNARTGMTAVYAPLGTFIPGLDFALDAKPRKIRGVESHGMMCSVKELEIGDDHDGIIDLEGDFEVGQPAAEALGLTDKIIDFEVTPNRPDWLGVLGVARDIAATGAGKFKAPETKVTKGEFPGPVSITLEAPDACPIFAGRLIKGVKNGPSPKWLQDRLKAIGINPKNLLVDVTNYISFDRCRPLHVYDAAKLKGGIVARMGTASDKFLALDGETYDKLEGKCVIADGSGAIGLGGIMGGVSTGCSTETTDVFIEAAWFDPDLTARTGRDTGILSDARFRFERGVDPRSCEDGIEAATAIILEHGGGEASEILVAGKPPKRRDEVVFHVRDMERLTGVDMKSKRMKAILEDLGFGIEKEGKHDWTLKVPSWRPDIEGSADIVEELIRIEGYDALPDAPLPPLETMGVVVTPLQNRVRIARRVMAARGFLETVTWSFMSKDKAALALDGANALSDALTIDNPIASDLDYMRPTMMANLAEAAQRNMDHGAEDVRLFEAGPVYDSDAPDGQRTLVAGLVQAGRLRHWAGNPESYDAMAAKADAFAVLEALGQPTDKLMVMEPVGPHWHPGRAATLRLGPKNVLATFGELHPGFLKALDVKGRVAGFEVDLGAIPEARAKGGKTRPVLDKADQTPVRRDFAFVVDEQVAAEDILKAARKAEQKLIANISVFDIYRGTGLDDGKKSVAIEVTLQPRGEALKDEDIDRIAKAIVAGVEKATGGALRG